MSRAYIRLGTDLPDRKADYPDGAYRAYVDVLCYAAQQVPRGTFRNATVLRGYLGRRFRWVPFLIAHNDLELQVDGSLYVVGWHDWQEGDVTVAERMRRLRSRRSRVTEGVTAGVTESAVTDRIGNGTSSSNSRDDPALPVTPDVRRSVDTRSEDDRPRTFMGFRPKQVAHPVTDPTHWGQHPDCLVCGTATVPESDHPDETFDEFRERKARERTGNDDPPRDKSTGDGPPAES